MSVSVGISAQAGPLGQTRCSHAAPWYPSKQSQTVPSMLPVYYQCQYLLEREIGVRESEERENLPLPEQANPFSPTMSEYQSNGEFSVRETRQRVFVQKFSTGVHDFARTKWNEFIFIETVHR